MKRKILFLTLGILPLSSVSMNLNNTTTTNTEIKSDGINKFEELAYKRKYELNLNSNTIKEWDEYSEKKSVLFQKIKNDLSKISKHEENMFISEEMKIKLANLIGINFSDIKAKAGFYGVKITFYHDRSWLDFWGMKLFDTTPQFAPNYHDANIIEDYYKFLAHNQLKVGISRHEWEKMKKIGPNETKIYELIKNFPQLDKTGSGGYISDDNIHNLAKAIIQKMPELENKFENSTTGWKVVTYTDGTRISLEQE